ncbi:MAG: hypothetical protein K0U37_06485 [Gammaproteobacteria bacterium]|nr:hypothetical protein [Gammaproteobacteria bacterium]
MSQRFFSQPDLKKTVNEVVKENDAKERADVQKRFDEVAGYRGVRRDDVEKLFDEVRKNIVVPLQTVIKNRPGNKNNEDALKEVSTLCHAIEEVITPSKSIAEDDASDVPVISPMRQQ